MQTFLAKFYEAVIFTLAAFLLLALLGLAVQTLRVGFRAEISPSLTSVESGRKLYVN